MTPMMIFVAPWMRTVAIDNVLVTAEPPLPERVTDDDRLRRAGLVIGRR